MFHVQLRRFPHTAQAYNLSESDLRSTVLEPWTRGVRFRFGERDWNPVQTQLTVLEGPRLDPNELSLGRGWSNAQRRAQDVTARLVDAMPRSTPGRPAAPPEFNRELLVRGASAPLSLRSVWEMANGAFSGRRVSERLAIAESAVRELLSTGQAQLCRASGGGAPAAVPVEEHEALLLAWESWTDLAGPTLVVRDGVANAAERADG